MSTEVSKSAASTALAALGNLKQGLANVQTQIRTPGGDPILRMGRDGIWIYGADNVEVEEGAEWAINPMSLQHGYINWKIIPDGSKEKAELYGEEVRSMFEPLPNKDSLPVYSDGKWVEEVLVGMKCLNGADEGEEVIYKPSSTGGLRAMKELIAEIMKQIDKDPANPVPVVSLETDHYQHKQWGKTYVPEIKIVRWVSMDGVAGEAAAPQVEEQGEAAQPEPEEKPRQSRRAAPAEETTAAEPQPEQAAEQGGGERRRRRRVA